jgi:hypothetical protein
MMNLTFFLQIIGNEDIKKNLNEMISNASCFPF